MFPENQRLSLKAKDCFAGIRNPVPAIGYVSERIYSAKTAVVLIGEVKVSFSIRSRILRKNKCCRSSSHFPTPG